MCIEILKDCKDRWDFYEQNARKLQREEKLFINIGRNNVITEKEILTALNSSWIGGAVLDGFEVEPLPKSSPLWDYENVVITPHGFGITSKEEIADFFEENLKKCIDGKAFEYVIDWNRGY